MSLTLAEARARAHQISEVSYGVVWDVRGEDDFGVGATVRFTTSQPTTFLELSEARELSLTVDGEPVTPSYDGRRILLDGLPTGVPVEVGVSARLPYVTDGSGMHTVTDPADGARYVSAYLGMDLTQKVLPCFDQVDLKAPVSVTVVAPAGDTVLANGALLGRDRGDSHGDGAERWRFATTPPVPVDQLVVAVGPWHSVTWEHRGLPFGWHARRSLAADLDRDADELRATTEACFDHYATLFTEPYAFDSYDQVFVPGHNWGAMESPGCITYRDELLPRGRTSEEDRALRASVIAHEMAHMWFGNLVTMRWWEDTWLNESFADYMGYRVAADAAGFTAALLGHELVRKPVAYDADRRRSTHPVAPLAEDVPDVDAAFNNFDAISYAKGNSALRQLVTWMGDEDFLAGVNVHLTRHRFANATLEDLVGALDEASERDVRGWVESWLRRSGHDVVRVVRDGEVPVLLRDGSRAHRVHVAAYDEGLVRVGTRFVDLDDDPVALPEWSGLVVLPNVHGETFARLRLDASSWAALARGLSTMSDPLARGLVWATAFEMVDAGELTLDGYLQLVGAHLPAETESATIAAVLHRTHAAVVPRRVPADRAAATLDVIADTCRAGLARRPDADRTLALAHGVARTTRDETLLRDWLEADRVEDVSLDPALRWALVQRLADLGVDDAEELVAEHRRRDPGLSGDLGAAHALAARPTSEAKDAAWELARDADVSNRVYEATMAGLWSAEQTELLAPYVTRYLRESPDLVRHRGQGFGQVVGRAFPPIPLSDEQLAELETALAGDVPPVLRRQWEDRLDDLRASRP